MTLDKKVSDLLPAQIPDYVQEFYPLFVVFITKYFEWLEQPGNPQEIIQNIQLNTDIDTTASSLAAKFMSIYAPSFPQVSALDRTILVKNFREFYRSKGSEESFKYFFRAFFNDDIIIKLPGDQLFSPSSADWYVEKKLRVNAVSGDPRNLTTVEITGTSSNATAVVEEIVKTYNAWDLRLENRSLKGTFDSSETIVGTYYDFVNDISSQITVVNTQELQTLPGRIRGNASLLSSDQVLQDSIYWQKFSYVIRTRTNLDRWQDAVLEQLHPTGRNIFGELLLDNDTSIAVSSATQFVQSNAIESQVSLFTSSNSFYLVPGVTWDRLANFRTGTSATTTAGAITFDAGFTYGGENVTFALQGAIDGATVFDETYTFTSITGTINVPVTTGQTTYYRDAVRYSAPVTSITGTINAVGQIGGDSITFTGTGTQFTSDLIPSLGQLWWRNISEPGQQPSYNFYPAVLTIRELPITGTVTIAAQTPTAPDYFIYVSGTGTKFRSDLLISGLDTGFTSLTNETTSPVVEEGQPEVRVFLDNVPLTGDITFTSGSTSVVGVGTSLQSELYVGGSSTLTVTKPLFGRFNQVTSIPAQTEWYATSATLTQGNFTLSGSALSFALTTSNYSAIATTAYGFDRNTRYDIPLPFPVQFLTTSTTKLYVHASGFIASDTSAPSRVNGNSNDLRPFVGNKPFVGVSPDTDNNLNILYHGVQGTAPNRYYTIHYSGNVGRRLYVNDVVMPSEGQVLFPGNGNDAISSRGIVGLTAYTAPTSGNATNGWYEVNLPWNVPFGTTGYSTAIHTKLFVSTRGIASFSSPVDVYGVPITTAHWTQQVYYGLNYLGLGSPYMDTQGGHINQINRIYHGVQGSSPNRIFVLRVECDWHTSVTQAAGASRHIVELSWRENVDITGTMSVAWHSPALPLDTQEYYYHSSLYSYVAYTQRNADNSGDLLYYNVRATTANWLHAGSSYTQNAEVAVTSGSIIAPELGYTGIISLLDFDVLNETNYLPEQNPRVWEMSFPENSSSPFILRRGANNDNGLSYANYYTEYRGTINVNRTGGAWEWSEGGSFFGINSSLVTNIFSRSQPLQVEFRNTSIVTALFTKYPSASSLSATIPSTTSNSLLLLRSWNASVGGDEQNPTTVSTDLQVDFTTGTTPGSGNGVIFRFPQDGFNATTGSPNPNPTLSPSLHAATVVTGYNWNRVYFGSGSTYSPVTTSITGVLFSYGSSALVHSRFLQTTPTYGKIHRLTVTGHVGNDNVTTPVTTSNTTVVLAWLPYNNLAAIQANQELEAWYSRDPSTQPPTAGQSPATLGWIRAGVLASSADKTVTGGRFNRFWEVTTSEDRSTVTWLIWQKAFTTQTSNAAQRTSEYLITNIRVTGTPVDTRANSRLVVGSGTVVRVPNRTSKLGATVLEDFYVAEDPNVRRINGDNYLVLRPVGTVTSVPYLSAINSWSSTTSGSATTTSLALNNVALNNVSVSFVETRNINSITSQTSLTVTAAWTSTSNRAWGNGSGTGVSARAFAIESVLSDTSMVLRNIAGAIRFNAPITTTTTIPSLLADRRFTVVAVNDNTDVQVSGGGIYANIVGKTATFATPKPTTIDGQTGYLLFGAGDYVTTSDNTQWVTNGFPGTDDRGNNYGTNLNDLTATIYYYFDAEQGFEGSSFTVLRVLSNSSMLVTGNIITANFLNVPMTAAFPANSSEITVIGTGTQFVATSVTVSSATQVFEQVTEFDFNDRRTGYLDVSGQLLRVISVVNDTTLIVSSLAIRAPIVSSGATSFRRVKGFAPPRALGRPGGASFDKAGANVNNDETLIVQDANVDYTQIRELYHSTSNLTLGTSTTLLSTSISVTTGSSVLLLVTWTKDLADSADEVLNQLTITVSSAGTFTVGFDAEVQRNHKDIAQGRTQLYSGSVYLNSSNSISSNTVSHGDTTSSASWIWVPYNVKRSGTYSRFTVLISSSQSTSISIDVGTDLTGSWQSLAGDFLNISVIGTS
jgi:hypothetical protein